MSELYSHIRKQLITQFDEHESSSMAFILLEDTSGLSRTDVLMGRDDLLDDSLRKDIEDKIHRLLNNEPIQYVTGKAEFYGMSLHVEPGVLIPRPETEELVELLCSRLKQETNPKILDIGTGSGCIALAVKTAISQAEVHACDISDKALQIASVNAEALGLDIHFHKTDILSEEDCSGLEIKNVDAIISNPPYICDEEKKEMDRNVLDNEPHIALFVPDDKPLLFYKAITHKATIMLKNRGMLAFEINRRFGEATKELMEQYGFIDTEIIKDQFGNDRMVIGYYEKDSNC